MVMTGILGGGGRSKVKVQTLLKKNKHVELQTHHCQFHCTSLIMTPAHFFWLLRKALEKHKILIAWFAHRKDRASGLSPRKKNISKLKK